MRMTKRVFDGLESKILHSATPLVDVAVPDDVTQPQSPMSITESAHDSDPLGLTSSNDDSASSRVFIIDPNNPDAIFDTSGLSRNDVTAQTPLGDLSALANSAFLREGDAIYVRGGEYTLEETVIFHRDDTTFAAYPGEEVTIRHGSFEYQWAFQANGDNFHLQGIDFVGNVDTPDGRLYSQLLFRVSGNNSVVEDCIFRHNANFLSPDEGGDIAFGNRYDRYGELLPEGQQLWGRTFLFDHSQDSVFRNNVVVSFEAAVVEEWEKGNHSVEGLMLNNSEVLIENNQFGSAGHQMISSRFSTVQIRNNTFGDVSEYADQFGIELSEYVQIPSTHTAASLYINDSSTFEGNIVVYNTADPDDNGNGLQVHASTNSEVFNNLFVDSGGTGHGIAIGFNRYSSVEVESAYNRIFNNTFYNVSSPISVGYFHSAAPEGGEAVHHNEIFNNVITYSDEKKTSPHDSVNSPVKMNFGDPLGGNGNLIYNNLIHDFDSNVVAKSNTATGNLEFTADDFNDLPFANGNIFGRPIFAWTDGGDFRVHESVAPSLDLGSTETLDMTGVERQAGGFIGAFDSFRVFAPAASSESDYEATEATDAKKKHARGTAQVLSTSAKEVFTSNMVTRNQEQTISRANALEWDRHVDEEKSRAREITDISVDTLKQTDATDFSSPKFVLESLHKRSAPKS